jgi:hypothetical protein
LYALRGKEYSGEPAMLLFEEHFPSSYDFGEIERKVFADKKE